jgi:hypothetical protein
MEISAVYSIEEYISGHLATQINFAIDCPIKLMCLHALKTPPAIDTIDFDDLSDLLTLWSQGIMPVPLVNKINYHTITNQDSMYSPGFVNH